MTEWRQVPGFPNYEVSDLGVVASRRRGGAAGKSLKPLANQRGYLSVCLRPWPSPIKISHIVLWAFVGPRPPGQETRHLDGDHTNNARSNLAWGTPTENAADMERHGTRARGSAHGKSKLNEAQAIEAYRSPEMASALAFRFGVSKCAIYDVREGRTWRQVTGARLRA